MKKHDIPNEEIKEEILQDWYGGNKYRELELGERILEGDMFLFENAIMRKATDIGNGVYTTNHWPHYREVKRSEQRQRSDLQDC